MMLQHCRTHEGLSNAANRVSLLSTVPKLEPCNDAEALLLLQELYTRVKSKCPKSVLGG